LRAYRQRKRSSESRGENGDEDSANEHGGHCTRILYARFGAPCREMKRARRRREARKQLKGGVLLRKLQVKLQGLGLRGYPHPGMFCV
jgi:hypothetical protein